MSSGDRPCSLLVSTDGLTWLVDALADACAAAVDAASLLVPSAHACTLWQFSWSSLLVAGATTGTPAFTIQLAKISLAGLSKIAFETWLAHT